MQTSQTFISTGSISNLDGTISTTTFPVYDYGTITNAISINGEDIYIGGTSLKEYIDKRIAEAGQSNIKPDPRKYKVVMGEL